MKYFKKLSKRGLAVLLALAMCVGMLNLTAFAAEEGEAHEHDAVACATCGGTGSITDISACPDCGGEIEMITCEKCDGDGWLGRYVIDWDSPCPVNGEACNGCSECTMGYKKVLVTWDCDACGGAGEVPAVTVETETCSKCDGDGWLGRYTIDWDTPCPVNGEACNGCSECTMGYKKVLVTWDCDACDGWGTIVVASEGACETCGGRGQVKASYECATCEGTGKVPCNGVFDDGKLTKNDEDGTGTMTYTCAACKASYTEDLTHDQVVTILGNAGHVEPAEGVETVSATCTQEGSKVYTCAVEGCGAVVTETISKAKHSFKNNVCVDCSAVSVTVYGAYMGRWYNFGGGTSESPASAVLSADMLITAENLGLDTSTGFWGEFVTNFATTKTWQLVGFVPETTGWGFDEDKLAANYVYTNSEESGEFRSCGNLDEVKAYVAKEGILYGEPVTANMAGRIAAVWYVADINVEIGEYGDLSIAPVEVPALRENSTGIEVHCNLDTLGYNHSTGVYNVDLVITIGANAPYNAHVNLVPGIAEAVEMINTGLGANDTFQPGDELQVNVTINNQSGRQYTYDRNSGLIATNPDLSVNGDAGVGFDGFRIPHSTNAEYAFIARRILNDPLQKLGLNGNDLSDEAVGAALRNLGYGSENDSEAEIAQTYLVNYYLDYTNAARKVANVSPAASFEDLTMREIMVFTTGDTGTAVFEKCPAVVEALYFYYFGHVLTFNDVSFYQQMVNYTGHVSEMESAVPALLRGETYQISVKLAGEEVPNGFQNTQFGFRVEFDLTYTPVPVTPPPTPSPAYTTLTVVKEWIGDDEEDRPASVTAQLYRNGSADFVLVGQPTVVTLDEEGGWSYTWTGLDDSYTWTVGEIDVPEGYTSSVSVSPDGVVVTITNTYEEEFEEPPVPLGPPPEPDEEIEEPPVPKADVPETGDSMTLWLGIAAVSGVGMVFAVSSKRKESEEA